MRIINTFLWISTIVFVASFLQSGESSHQPTISLNSENDEGQIDDNLEGNEETIEEIIECIFEHKDERNQFFKMLLVLKPILDDVCEYHTYLQKVGDSEISNIINKIEKELEKYDEKEDDSIDDDSEDESDDEELQKRHSDSELEVPLKLTTFPEYQAKFDRNIQEVEAFKYVPKSGDKSIHVRDTVNSSPPLRDPELNQALTDENNSECNVNDFGKKNSSNNALYRLISILGGIYFIPTCHLSLPKVSCCENDKLLDEIINTEKDKEILTEVNKELIRRNKEIKLQRLNCNYSNTNRGYLTFTTQRQGRQSSKNKKSNLEENFPELDTSRNSEEYSTVKPKINNANFNSGAFESKEYPVQNTTGEQYYENNTEKNYTFPNKDDSRIEETSDITSNETSFPITDLNRTEPFDLTSDELLHNNFEIDDCPNNTETCSKPESEFISTSLSKENEQNSFIEFKNDDVPEEGNEHLTTNFIKPQNNLINEIISDEPRTPNDQLGYGTDKKYHEYPTNPENCFICAEPVDFTTENEQYRYQDYSTNGPCKPHYLPIEVPCDVYQGKHRIESQPFFNGPQYQNKSPPRDFYNYQKNKLFEETNENNWYTPNYRKSTAHRHSNSYETPVSSYNDIYYSNDEIEFT